MKRDSLFYTVVFSFSITFILVFILSLASSYTRERVERSRSIAVAKAYLLAGGVEIDEGSDIEKIFADTFKTATPTGAPLEAKVHGRSIIVSPFSGKGLWGTINGVIALETDYSRIIGVEITSHTETPGLGGRIDEKWFKDQFKGEVIDEDIKIVQSGGMGDTNPDNGILDGITGATRTSESMQNIINDQIKSLKGGDLYE